MTVDFAESCLRSTKLSCHYILSVYVAVIVSAPSMLSVAEEGGAIQLCATLTTPVETVAEVAVTLETRYGTGTYTLCVIIILDTLK